MAKQILAGVKELSLNEVAHYLMIYIPFNEEIHGLVKCMKTATP